MAGFPWSENLIKLFTVIAYGERVHSFPWLLKACDREKNTITGP